MATLAEGLEASAGSPRAVARLDAAAIAGAKHQLSSRLPVASEPYPPRLLPEHDVWDMWPVSRRDGSTFERRGRQLWFFLATPILPDPEDRHDIARIRLTSRGVDGWRDHGWVFADDWSPGTREWSGCAVIDDDNRRVTMYFTAAGRRGRPHTFEQRLFEAVGELDFVGEAPVLRGWSAPVESLVADGRWYKVADQQVAPTGGIWGFRDPSYFRDPADGSEFLLFTGSARWTDDPFDGVIGLASRTGDQWRIQPPLIEAVGVGNELERPHLVWRDGHYYCFWSSHGRRYAPALSAPTGLYGMIADRLAGPWRPLNASGLVAANPTSNPVQAYCWWVTGEGEVISFLDYPAEPGSMPPADPAVRRALFGGTVAPGFRLSFDGDRVLPTDVCQFG